MVDLTHAKKIADAVPFIDGDGASVDETQRCMRDMVAELSALRVAVEEYREHCRWASVQFDKLGPIMDRMTSGNVAHSKAWIRGVLACGDAMRKRMEASAAIKVHESKHDPDPREVDPPTAFDLGEGEPEENEEKGPKFVVYISAIYEVTASTMEEAREIAEDMAEACDKAIGDLDEFADGTASIAKVLDERKGTGS